MKQKITVDAKKKSETSIRKKGTVLSLTVFAAVAMSTIGAIAFNGTNDDKIQKDTKTAKTNTTTTAVTEDVTTAVTSTINLDRITWKKAALNEYNYSVSTTEKKKSTTAEKKTKKASSKSETSKKSTSSKKTEKTKKSTKETTAETKKSSARTKKSTTAAETTSVQRTENNTPAVVNTSADNVSDTPVISYTNEEFDMLCYVLQGEVGDCSEESKLAVANVIINRVKCGQFGSSNIAGILTTGNQFTAISGYYNRTTPPTQNTVDCAYRALHGEDNTNGATFYYAPRYCGGSTAAWFESLQFCMELEGQRFFKNW